MTRTHRSGTAIGHGRWPLRRFVVRSKHNVSISPQRDPGIVRAAPARSSSSSFNSMRMEMKPITDSWLQLRQTIKRIFGRRAKQQKRGYQLAIEPLEGRE